MKIVPRNIFEINNTEWIKEDIRINSRVLFSYKEALDIAKSMNCRLPTVEDIAILNKLNKDIITNHDTNKRSIKFYGDKNTSDFISFNENGNLNITTNTYTGSSGYYWIAREGFKETFVYDTYVNVSFIYNNLIADYIGNEAYAFSLKLIKL